MSTNQLAAVKVIQFYAAIVAATAAIVIVVVVVIVIDRVVNSKRVKKSK